HTQACAAKPGECSDIGQFAGTCLMLRLNRTEWGVAITFVGRGAPCGATGSCKTSPSLAVARATHYALVSLFQSTRFLLHLRLLPSAPPRHEATPRLHQVCARLVQASQLLMQVCALPAGDSERILGLHLGERRNGLVVVLQRRTRVGARHCLYPGACV